MINQNFICFFQMPLLDASLLSGHKQLRVAFMFLSFIGGGYIWQDGEENMPKVS